MHVADMGKATILTNEVGAEVIYRCDQNPTSSGKIGATKKLLTAQSGGIQTEVNPERDPMTAIKASSNRRQDLTTIYVCRSTPLKWQSSSIVGQPLPLRAGIEVRIVGANRHQLEGSQPPPMPGEELNSISEFYSIVSY